MINKRLSNLSCNEDEFKRAKPLYENALKESGYKVEVKNEATENTNNRNRQRKILWFNPPFSQSVKTNIGKVFLKLVRKHFPRHHKLHKLFITNTLRLSYCCMKNISNITKQHNATALSTSTTPKRLCNCNNCLCNVTYRCGTRRCDLCITEEYIIARADQERLLNERTEFISKGRHRNKFLLKNVE